MKIQGQSIKLFIIESLKKLKTAELSNWVGKAYIGERKHSLIIKKLEELNNTTGIYLLLSNSEEDTTLYIGEADDVASRVHQHYSNKEKTWWEQFVIFISKDANLTKSHVRYLEKELYLLAKENLTTINLDNDSTPPGSNLPNSDISDMSIFLQNIIFVLNNLGIIDFTSITTEKAEVSKVNENIFYLNLSKSNLKSYLTIDENGYKLLKGSYLELEVKESFKNSSKKLRNKLIENKLIIPDEKGVYIAIEDIYFKSPSAAAAIVRGRAANGQKEWKLPNGKTLYEFESEV